MINKGAKLNIIGDYGKTPLDRAIQDGATDTIRLLRAHGAKTAVELQKETEKK